MADEPSDTNRVRSMSREQIIELFAWQKFADPMGHALVNCQDFLDLVDEARAARTARTASITETFDKDGKMLGRLEAKNVSGETVTESHVWFQRPGSDTWEEAKNVTAETRANSKIAEGWTGSIKVGQLEPED